MDFNQFDSVKAAEQGRELHLKHPASRELLYADSKKKKPCIVVCLGAESSSVQKALKKRRAEMAESRGRTELADLDNEEIQADFIASAKPLITGFKNIHNGNKPADLEDVDWFLGLQRTIFKEGEPSFAEQVLEFASSRANFLGNSKLH